MSDQPAPRTAVTPRPSAVQRRFVLLSGLRWLPNGVLVPIVVLLGLSRGHGIGTIGGLFALHGVLVAALELPTGGLADVLGRRRVLLVSGVLLTAAAAVFAVAVPMWQFAVGVSLLAVGRALGSGPLEAWYVDAVHAVDPDADLRPGLSRGAAAEALGLALGAVTGGLLPGLLEPLATDSDAVVTALSAPALLSAALGAVYVVLVGLLVVEPRRSDARPTLRSVVRDVPATVAGGVRLAGGDSVIVRVLLASLAAGTVGAGLEVLTPIQLADLLGGEEDGTAAYGLLLTLAFLSSAAGSSVAPALARLAKGTGQGAATATALGALALIGMATGAPFVVVAGSFVMVYLLIGTASPLKSALLHGRTTAAQRATVVSVQSLSVQLGVVIGSAALPAIAATSGGYTAAWLTGGLILFGAALLLPGTDRVVTAAGTVPARAATHPALASSRSPCRDGRFRAGSGRRAT